MNVLRERMRNFLSTNSMGVLTISGMEGTWAMPVRYRVKNLELYCLVPRWADIAYHVELHPGVLMVILSVFLSPKDSLRWLQYKGNARPMANPNWEDLLLKGASKTHAQDMYLILHVVPERIDLLDESRGWGVRETLEIDDASS